MSTACGRIQLGVPSPQSDGILPNPTPVEHPNRPDVLALHFSSNWQKGFSRFFPLSDYVFRPGTAVINLETSATQSHGVVPFMCFSLRGHSSSTAHHHHPGTYS